MKLDGVKIIVTASLPIAPTDGEDIVRMVRHGLADVLDWLGEDVGPKPGDQTHAVRISNRVTFVSQELFDKLKDGIE